MGVFISKPGQLFSKNRLLRTNPEERQVDFALSIV
jgi:hypothetical protein